MQSEPGKAKALEAATGKKEHCWAGAWSSVTRISYSCGVEEWERVSSGYSKITGEELWEQVTVFVCSVHLRKCSVYQ